MNLFYLDRNIEKCAQFHIDKHVGKMQCEIAQMMTTNVWIDRLIGEFIPRKVTSEENKIITDFKKTQPKDIDKRTFTRYFPCHINHPTTVWMRSNKLHFDYAKNLVNELNKECVRRGYKSHSSCVVANQLDVENIPILDWEDPALAMPPELQSNDHVSSYRLFYMLDKGPIAKWRNSKVPYWWDTNVALTDKRYNQMTDDEKRKAYSC